jgi:molybdopterin/thiamine biosynthesis adenylyltransferase
MPRRPTARNPELQRLLEAGYEARLQSSYLVIENVPYVTPSGTVARGTLVSEFAETSPVPTTHVAYWAGEHPCNRNATPITAIGHGSGRQLLAEGLEVDHSFSGKKRGGYESYLDKVDNYVRIISAPAQALDPSVSAQTAGVRRVRAGRSVFLYADSASTRAEIVPLSEKLAQGSVAIVGVGGTGSYVLDLVAKTPVPEIHLFDGDIFRQHNAFRGPGAASFRELAAYPQKVHYWASRYRRMHRGIVAHDTYIDASNVALLSGFAFVFLCLDAGSDRRPIVEHLEAQGIAFIDVGIGLQRGAAGKLVGILRVTTSTPEKRDHVQKRVPYSNGMANEYSRNIQVADLNMLTAALAVQG